MAHRTSQERIWPYLAILGMVAYVTISVPRHWEVSGRNRTLDEVLAARPQAIPTNQRETRPQVEPLPEVVIVKPEKPVSDPFLLPSQIVENQDLIHDDWLDPPADPPLPSADDDPYANPAPLDGWPRPHSLLLWLEHVAREPMCADWAERTAAQIGELTTERRPSAARTQELLNEMRATVPFIQSFIDRTESYPLQSELRRTRYALNRRLDFWQIAQDSEHESYDRLVSRAPLDKLALPPQRVAPRVDEAVSEVRAYTEQHDNGSTWERYLRLAELDKLAVSKAADIALRAERRKVAHQVLLRLTKVSYHKRYVPVAQNPAIGQLRESLRHWASETVDARELLEHIEQYENYGLPSNAREIAIYYQRLAFSPNLRGQQMGNQLARHYRNANVRLAVSGELLNRLLPAPSTITEPIDDIILGVPSYGTSNIETKLRVKLIPDENRLHLALEAHGIVESESESDAGFATLLSQGTSHFAARKTIVVDRVKIRTEPAIARAESSSELVDISTRIEAVPLFGSLADNIVRNQHGRRYGEVVSEVEQKVAEKARQRLDEEVDQRTNALTQKLIDKVETPLRRYGLDPTTIGLETTSERIIFRHRLAGYEQLGAHTPRPRAPSDSLLSLQVHESALNNALENLQLAGKTFDVESLHKWIHERIGRKPSKIDEDMPEDVEIVFPARDVLRVTCDQGRVAVVLVFRKLTRGRQSWTNFGVRTYYEPQVVGRQIKLVRQGSFEIVSHKYGKKPQLLLRSIVARMMNETKVLDLVPAKFADDERLADLAVTQLDIVDGWIALAYGPQNNGRYVATREPAAETKK